MAHVRRTIGSLVAGAVLVLGAVLPAAAAPPAPAAQPAPAAAAPAAVDTGCDAPADGYAPPPECELLIVRAAGICLEAAPVLDYAVEATGTPEDTVTITWVNPDGPDLTQEGLPLTGRVYWPGTVVRDGVVVDWPGWILTPEGTWTEHDAYDFTRPEIQVVFEVNPSATTVVSYPPETSLCANPPRSGVKPVVDVTSGVLAAPEGPTSASAVLAAPEGPASASAVLAATGADTTPVLAVSGGLLLLGAGLVAVSVRRRHRAG